MGSETTRNVAPREAARRMTHAGVGLASLLLRFLPWWGAVVCCVCGIVGNAFVLPRVAPQIFRPNESVFGGVRAYPVAILLLVLLFPLRIAAGGWAILAVGDAMAALVGRAWGRARLPWNREKSVEGFVAFVAFGACAGAVALHFVSQRDNPVFGLFGEVREALGGGASKAGFPPAPAWGAVFVASGAAAAFGAIAESLRSRIDDNFRVALAAGTALYLLDPLRAAAGAGA
jgi:dolichol kinase